MHKHKHRNIRWNKILQLIIIALIIGIIVSELNLWAFWWIPFLFICLSKCRSRSHYRHEHKHKYVDDDDIDYV